MLSGVRVSLKYVEEQLGRGDSTGSFISVVRASLAAYGAEAVGLHFFLLSTMDLHSTSLALSEAVPTPRL